MLGEDFVCERQRSSVARFRIELEVVSCVDAWNVAVCADVMHMSADIDALGCGFSTTITERFAIGSFE